jgi:hypothetical protein
MNAIEIIQVVAILYFGIVMIRKTFTVERKVIEFNPPRQATYRESRSEYDANRYLQE